MTSLINNYYATFDRTSQKFSIMFPSESDLVAVRGFTDALAGNGFDRATELSLHPDDFDLFHVATYDCSTGIVVALPAPRLVEQGKQIAIKLGLPRQLEFPAGLVSALINAVRSQATPERPFVPHEYGRDAGLKPVIEEKVQRTGLFKKFMN